MLSVLLVSGLLFSDSAYDVLQGRWGGGTLCASICIVLENLVDERKLF